MVLVDEGKTQLDTHCCKKSNRSAFAYHLAMQTIDSKQKVDQSQACLLHYTGLPYNHAN